MADFQDTMDGETIFGASEEDLQIMPPDDFLEEHIIPGTEDDEDGPSYDIEAATDSFLKFIRETYSDDFGADKENREAAVEDLKFLAGDQWPDKIKRKRINKNKPVLTINRLPAFVGLVVNQRRANEAGIHVIPDEGGDKKKAQIRQGIIRSIEKRCRSSYVYNTAHLNQVACGDGAFEVYLEYADDDVFEQDIVIGAIPNAMAVVWDRMSVEPTGKDAGHCFVEDYLSTREFKETYPDAKITDFASNTALTTEARGEGWFVNNTVRVVKFWRMRNTMRTLAMLNEIGPDGVPSGDFSVVDVTEMPREQWFPRVVVNPETGQPYIRRSRVRYAQSYITNGVELLDGPYNMPVPRVPVFRAVGWEVYVGQNVQRFGLVRFLKDPQRMHNYWRSVVVEKLMQTPRPKWIAPSTAVEGRENAFRNSAQSDDPLLVYNGDAGVAPQLMPPAQLEQALIQEAGMAAQDIRDVSNLHEASLGMTGNEVSGKAITARQEIGETGVAIYQDNLNAAIEECGRVINRLLPYVYDTARKVRILGVDDKEQLIAINESDENDITSGKYDVTVVTGPSFATKRRQASESMLNMVNAAPETLSVALDKIIEAQDWPGSDQIARRLRMQLPDNMVDMDDLSEEEIAARQAQAQAQQQQFEMQQRAAEADIGMKEAQSLDYRARAADAQARAAKTFAEIDFEQLRLMNEQEKAQFDMLMEGAKFYAELNDQGDEDYG
jgi:hypothetical protein